MELAFLVDDHLVPLEHEQQATITPSYSYNFSATTNYLWPGYLFVKLKVTNLADYFSSESSSEQPHFHLLFILLQMAFGWPNSSNSTLARIVIDETAG